MTVIIFAQSEYLNDVRALEVEPTSGGAGVREALLAVLSAGGDIQALQFYIEDSDDEHAIEKLTEIPDGLRVHAHRLKGIDVNVRYAGRDVRRTFRPSATLQRVKGWAVHELGIAASDAAELMLQVSGTAQRPDPDTHIGALVKFPNRTLCLDLVPSTRVNG